MPKPNGLEEFYKHVEFIPFHECYEWTKANTKNRYGSFSIRNRSYNAHKAHWVLVNGPVPDGLHVCHRCDNPGCVRLEHLFLGTNAENMRDMWSKRRRTRIKDMGPAEYSAWRAQRLSIAQQYRESNRQEINAKGRLYSKENRDRMNRYRREWRARRRAMGLLAT